jgi:hypothetical protein
MLSLMLRSGSWMWRYGNKKFLEFAKTNSK